MAQDILKLDKSILKSLILLINIHLFLPCNSFHQMVAVISSLIISFLTILFHPTKDMS